MRFTQTILIVIYFIDESDIILHKLPTVLIVVVSLASF